MCLNKSCSEVRTDKNLCSAFPIQNGLKRGGALSPLLSVIAVVYVIGKVETNQEGLELNETDWLLVSADDVKSTVTRKRIAEALLEAYLKVHL
jgi:hypothetical protein